MMRPACRPEKIGIIALIFIALLVWHDACDARRDDQGLGMWWAPDSAWAIRLSEVRGREKLPGLLERRPEEVTGWLMLELLAREEGEWFWIRLRLEKVERLTFTKRTKIIVTDKGGHRFESEAVFFWPDYEQTSLFDSRRSPVVVTNHSVWRGSDGHNPTGCAKFPPGSVRADDIISFEVLGAIAEEVD